MSKEKKTPVVYAAGRMRGVQYFNFPAFDKARERLGNLGLAVLSPADMDRKNGFDPWKYVDDFGIPASEIDWSHIPHWFDLQAAIKRDNEAIEKSDAIYVIHEGISESAGGMAEIELGMRLGKIILFDTMDDAAILKALGVPETVPVTPMRTASSLKAEYDRFSKDCCEALGIENVFDPLVKKMKESQTLPRYTEREGVLDEAKKLITGDRNNSYGPPTQDFQRTADMMSALFSAKLKEGARFKPSDVAWIITLVKASRAQHSPKRDNYVDAAGYMACGWECEAEGLKNAQTPGV